MCCKDRKNEIIDAFKNGFVVCHLKGDEDSFDSDRLCGFMIENMDSLLANQINLSDEPDFKEER